MNRQQVDAVVSQQWWYFRVKVFCEGYYMNRQQVDAVVSKYTLLYHPECELHIFVPKFLLHPEHLITRTMKFGFRPKVHTI